METPCYLLDGRIDLMGASKGPAEGIISGSTSGGARRSKQDRG
jgi:hypothetical protein